MPADGDARLLDLVRRSAHPLSGIPRDFEPLMDLVGDARFVLLGEASHGTHEFYAERARIKRRLIDEKGITAVAVEADWPNAYRVNRHARGAGDDDQAVAAMGGFRRFPTWMWRNADVLGAAGRRVRRGNSSRPHGSGAAAGRRLRGRAARRGARHLPGRSLKFPRSVFPQP